MAVPAEKLQRVRAQYGDKSHEELLEVIADLIVEDEEEAARRVANDEILLSMTKQYQELEEKNKALQATIDGKEKEIAKLNGVIEGLKHFSFGRSTEQLGNLVNASPAEEHIDEADTDDETTPKREDDQASSNSGPNREQRRGAENNKGHSGGKKGRKRGTSNFKNLPHYYKYCLDPDEMDRLYGKGNWRIVYWEEHSDLVIIPTHAYVEVTCKPKISHGLEHSLVTLPYDAPLCQRSFATPSAVAWIMYLKFFLALSYCRIEAECRDLGFSLRKQTMNSWVLRFAECCFRPIYAYFKALLLTTPYHQCDETPMQVNKDGRDTTRSSYFWVHTTSQLAGVDPIILFCFELTRSTEHLRKFYQDFTGFITCDAYCSYQTLEKENLNIIAVCGCMMHLRRRFVEALRLIDKSDLSEETIYNLPEYKAIDLIGDIYDADEPLKNLSPEERLVRRNEDVRPLVENFYQFVDSLDVNDPLMGAKLKDAVQYAQNQKEHLMRFLTDGHIPLDNGFCERGLRPLTTLRRSSLFCDSISGANATAIMCSVVETAQANKANVYWYLRYVLETMPAHTDMMGKVDDSEEFLDTMMPWSEEYRAYEAKNVSSPAFTFTPVLGKNEYSEPPRTPRRRDRLRQVLPDRIDTIVTT